MNWRDLDLKDMSLCAYLGAVDDQKKKKSLLYSDYD
jgi:hypothetical protein